MSTEIETTQQITGMWTLLVDTADGGDGCNDDGKISGTKDTIQYHEGGLLNCQLSCSQTSECQYVQYHTDGYCGLFSECVLGASRVCSARR